MAGFIQTDIGISGRTLYALVWDTAGDIWNGTSFETYTTANYANYDIPLTELGTASGYYSAAFPTTIDNGLYFVSVRRQTGGSPSETDSVNAYGEYSWDGINDDFVARDHAENDVRIEGVVADATPAAGSFDGDAGLSGTDDFYNGSNLVFISGTLKGIARRVDDYTGATNTFTFNVAFPVAPADTDNFLIIGRLQN
jgi:hypothetical protein